MSLRNNQAVLLAAFTNLVGAMWGTAVAKTISSGPKFALAPRIAWRSEPESVGAVFVTVKVAAFAAPVSTRHSSIAATLFMRLS